MLRTIEFVSFLLYLCQANKLPDYIKPCYQKDPNFEKCIEVRANEILPILIKGDKTLNLPPLSPFTVDLNVPSGKSYAFNLKGGKVEGLEGIQYRESKFSLKRVEAGGVLFFPKLVITGSYEIDGKILNKPVRGSGIATIILNDVSLTLTWPFNAYKKNGIDYLKMLKPTSTYRITRASYSFAKNNQPVTELNELVGGQSKIFTEDIAPSLTQSVSDLSVKAINAVINYAAFNEIFLP